MKIFIKRFAQANLGIMVVADFAFIIGIAPAMPEICARFGYAPELWQQVIFLAMIWGVIVLGAFVWYRVMVKQI